MMSAVPVFHALCLVTAVTIVGVAHNVHHYSTTSGLTEPVPVCRVFNWRKMTCTWQEPNNETAHHLEFSYRAFDRVAHLRSCPENMKRERNGNCHGSSCTWDESQGTKMSHNSWLRTKFCIFAVNSRTNEVATKQAFAALEIVKPAPVEVIASNISSRSVHLKWKWSPIEEGIGIVVKFRVNISEVGQNATVQTIPLQTSSNDNKFSLSGGDENFNFTVGCQYILPFRQYILKFQCIPLVNGQETGYWSDPAIVSFTSLADVPDALPKTTSGGFAVAPNGKVRFFWQPVEESLKNGNITNNLVTASRVSRNDMSAINTINVRSSETSVELELESGYNYSVDVRSRTEIGYNDSLIPTPVYILLSPATVKPNLTDLALIINGTSPYAIWNSTGIVSGYTFYWCLKDKGKLQCGEPLQWQYTSHNVMPLPISNQLMWDYRFGLSAEVDDPEHGRISSGLNWIKCVYDDSESRSLESFVDYEYSKSSEGAINLIWSMPRCIASFYRIRLWDVKKPQDAKNYPVNHQNSRTSNQTFTGINGLEPHIEYHIEVRSWSANGDLRSHFCDRCVVQLKLESGISLQTNLIIICVIMVLLLLGLLVVCCRARIKKWLNIQVSPPPRAILTVDVRNQHNSGVGWRNSYVRADELMKIGENHNEGKSKSHAGGDELDKTVKYSEIKGVLHVQKKAADDSDAKSRRPCVVRILPEIPELTTGDRTTEDRNCIETDFCIYSQVARDDDEEEDDSSTSSECGDNGTTTTGSSSEKSFIYERDVRSHVTGIGGLGLLGSMAAPIEYVLGSDVSTDDGIPQSSPLSLAVGENVGNRPSLLSFEGDSPYVGYRNLQQQPRSSSPVPGQTVLPLSSPDDGIDCDDSPNSSGLYCLVQMNDGSSSSGNEREDA